MFNFTGMEGNYDSRSIDRTNFSWGFISTARVTDGSKPIETAIKSDEYAPLDTPEKTDQMIIVESYDSVEDAEAGHEKWRLLMETDPPNKLVDCCNSGIADLINGIGDPEGSLIEFRLPHNEE